MIKFKIIGDHRGSLTPLEQYKEIPFDIKRVYYIYNTKEGVVRGNHSHKNLEQLLICLNGSCIISVDSGTSKKEFSLKSRDEGLYIGNNIWREMYDFSSDCVLLVLASDFYNENEYIRNYKDFIDCVNSKY